ncbi:MAG: prephenate dehydrogenase [Candidatus Aminicenantia bacterium]
MKYDFFILGLGQIGFSLAIALRKFKIANKIYGKDINFKYFYTEIIDGYYENIRDGIRNSEIVILSTPVRSILNLIGECSPFLGKEKILIDTGSTKREIVVEMKKYNENVMIGGHPMAGSVKKGNNAYNGELFYGKPFFLVFPNENSRKGEGIVKDFIKRIGAIPVEVNENEHDFLSSITSHFPYIISLSLFSLYLDSYEDNKRIEQFISTGFLSSTRLSLTEPSVGIDIVMSNKENISRNIDQMILLLEKIREKIRREEIGEFIEKINKEAEKRRKNYEDVMV